MAKISVLVVGGGVMGLAAGGALAGRGVDVTVLERFAVGHEWASSHGLTRAIRHEYGSRAIYTRMVARSLDLWDELARETRRRLYTETGVLSLGQASDGETLAGYEIMRANGLPVELLAPDDCRQRFPMFDPSGYDAITYNPRGGMLYASECLLALADRLRARGGALREGARVARVAADGGGASVTLDNGTVLAADRVVVTAGPWIHDILPGLALPVQATRQQVCYLAGLPPEQFAIGTFPVFLAGLEYYGFPILPESGWLKLGEHIPGPSVDPNIPYETDLEQVERVRAFLRRVIPSAADGELALIDRCMYDRTPDEHFILDRYPGEERIVIGSGFSGHGFKFGVLIGELLAALALDEPPEFPLEQFRSDRIFH
jgi:monomeric sarcosine oxidase